MTIKELDLKLGTCDELSFLTDYLEGNRDDEITEDKFEELAEEAINEQEIIYYKDAIKYLSEHDNSLLDSLSLAGEAGFRLTDLNSGVLATLIFQNSLRDELTDFIKNEF